MRNHACCWFFCAVALLVCPSAGTAAEGGAEYRAPVSGLKLTPPQAQANTVSPPSTSAAGQTPVPATPAAPTPTPAGNAAASPPWAPPSGLTTYSATQAPPQSGQQAPPQNGQNFSQPFQQQNQQAFPPQGQRQGQQPEQFLESMPQNAAPYSSLSQGAGRNGDVVFGTEQLDGGDSEESGYVRQYRDPETGDIVTSVVPPKQPQPNYGTFFIAPQIYPDRRWPRNPGGSYPGGSVWPGGQAAPPNVIWLPGGQQANPPHRHERPHKNRRHADEYGGDAGYGRGGRPDASYPDGRNSGRSRNGEEDRRQ